MYINMCICKLVEHSVGTKKWESINATTWMAMGCGFFLPALSLSDDSQGAGKCDGDRM